MRSTPLFAEPLHVGCPNLGDRARLLARIEDLLDRRRLSNDGPFLQAFEQRIAEHVGVAHCVVVCNATIALQLAVRALDLRGEVIVPSFTFPATVHALALEGITPIFCDVDPLTHVIDPGEVERLVGPRTTGILAVHLWGNACDVGALADIAARHGLSLLFDAAHAFACSHQGQMIGGFGDAEVFSFHATKFVNAAEGGAIVTQNSQLAEALRRLRNFGYHDGEVVGVGTNAKMNELSAAVGLTSLESCATFIDLNQRNHTAYKQSLAGVRGLRLLAPDPDQQRHNYQYVVVEVDPQEAGMTRDQMMAQLVAQNVLARRHFWPGCHRLRPYEAAHAATRRRLPHTERLCRQLLQLPTGSAVSSDDIHRIGGFLRRLVPGLRRAA